MKRAINFIVGNAPETSTVDLLQARNLVLIDFLVLLFLFCLIVLNVLIGEPLIAGILPFCSIFILYSLYLIKRRKVSKAAGMTIFSCIIIISTGLFFSGDFPGPELFYRGILGFLILLAALPLISWNSAMSLVTGIASIVILQTFFWTRLYAPGEPLPDLTPTLLISSTVLPGIVSFLAYAVIRHFKHLGKDVEARSLNLEKIIFERTADLENSATLLKESESRYRSIVENSHDGIVIIDEEARISFCNNEILKISGYDQNEVLGRNFLDFVEVESRSLIAERHDLRMKGKEVPYIYEAWIIGKDGMKIPGEVRIVLYTDPGGKIKTVVQFLDIRSRRETEEILKHQYDLALSLGNANTLKEALEIIMGEIRKVEGVDCGGIYVIDSSTGDMNLVCHWGLSDTFIAAHSSMKSDSPQVNVLARDTPACITRREFSDKLSGEVIQHLEGEGLLTLTTIPVKHRNSVIAALNCASRTVDEFPGMTKRLIESIAGQVGTLISRLRAEDAVRASEEKYRLLLERSNNLIIATDGMGIVTYISPSITGISGYTPEEVIGRLFLDFIYAEDIPLIIAKYQELTHGILSPDEYRIVTKDGELRWIISNSKPLIEDGKFNGIIGVFTDITWRKQAEDERFEMERRLLHAQKLESLVVLAGGIAHDFNNILMAIMGNLELATATLPLSSAHRIHVDEAIHASRRAADLVKQMLAYSGSGSLIKMEINLSEIVEETTELLRASISKNARLALNLKRPIHAIIADPTQVQQIAMNLIVNASEAIGKSEGVIAVSSGEIECDDVYLSSCCLEDKPPAGRYAFLEVRDTGSGMDSNTLNKIFDPFFTTKFAGRGLGLAAVLGIVRNHGGAIIVSSSPGNGTSIRVLFPLTESMVETVALDESPPAAPMKKESAGTILIIDDDEMILRTAQAMLMSLGFRVLTAPGGREALEILRQRKDEINCALVDFTMKGMDGNETISAMRKIKPEMKAILSSGYHRDDVMERMGVELPDGFIQKPYLLRDLEDEIIRITMINA